MKAVYKKWAVYLPFIRRFLLRYRGRLALIALLGAANIGLNIIEPLLAQQIVDRALHLGSLEEIYLPALVWGAVFAVRYGAEYGAGVLKLRYKLQVLADLRSYFVENILRKKLAFFQKHTSGYLLSRYNNDIDVLEGILPANLIESALAAAGIVCVVALMCSVSPLLTAVILAFKLLDLYINFAFPLKLMYKKCSEARARGDKELDDMIQCVKFFKAADSARFETARFRRFLDVYFARRYERDAFNLLRQIITRVSQEASYPLIIIAGGVLVFYRQASVGEVMALLLYFQKLNPFFITAAYCIPVAKIALGGVERLHRVFCRGNEAGAEGAARCQVGKITEIEFADVSFKYGGKTILSHFSLKIRPRQMTALVGVSGAGKSTVVNLLLGFIKPDSGAIYINGVNLNDCDLREIRAQMGLLSQDPILLQRSVRKNICYHLDKVRAVAEEKLLRRYLELTDSAKVVDRLPGGLDYVFTFHGGNISQGEKQRICLSRELLKKAPVNIFDEATSSLDGISENIIMRAVEKLSRQGIVFIITHKLSNIKNADMIYVLHNGAVAEAGTHAELTRAGGVYALLWRNQNGVGGI